jgi:hypothetical protein
VNLAKTMAHFMEDIAQSCLSEKWCARHPLHQQVVTVDLRMGEISEPDGGHGYFGPLSRSKACNVGSWRIIWCS